MPNIKLVKQVIATVNPIKLIKSILLRKTICKPDNSANPEEVFTKIYQNGLWGRSPNPNEDFFSGTGSHTHEITKVYIDSVHNFVSKYPHIKKAVDIGCGDFNVGSQIRPFFESYIACDVVKPLIERNKLKYKDLDVDFRHLDFTEDPLPSGDIAFIRQVLQHLSNQRILHALPKLFAKYKFLVVTEHLPSGDFCPNLDMPLSHHIRLGINSGLILTEPPFNLNPKSSWELCNAQEYGGVIRTIAYQLK